MTLRKEIILTLSKNPDAIFKFEPFLEFFQQRAYIFARNRDEIKEYLLGLLTSANIILSDEALEAEAISQSIKNEIGKQSVYEYDTLAYTIDDVMERPNDRPKRGSDGLYPLTNGEAETIINGYWEQHGLGIVLD